MEAWLSYPLLLLVGMAAAGLNAIAGGGTFFTFPILIFCGLNPTLANTTNKFAIWVGALSSVGGYWQEVKQHRGQLRFLLAAGIIGSVAGSLALLATPVETFSAMVPWLMLMATLTFAFGRQLVARVAARLPSANGQTGWVMSLRAFGQLLIGIYGGFFGAGIGILMMALCQLIGVRSIHETNAIKVVVASGITSLSALTFVLAGVIAWQEAIPLSVGALIGGFFGASLARALPEKLIRGFIIVYGLAVSGYFFYDLS